MTQQEQFKGEHSFSTTTDGVVEFESMPEVVDTSEINTRVDISKNLAQVAFVDTDTMQQTPEVWEVDERVAGYFRRMFSVNVSKLTLYTNEQSIIVDMAVEARQSLGQRGTKSLMPEEQFAAILTEYVAGMPPSTIASELKIKHQRVSTVPSNFLSAMTRSGRTPADNLTQLIERIAAFRGIDTSELLAEVQRDDEAGKNRVLPLEEIDLSGKSELNNQEVASALIHRLRLNDEALRPLLRYLSRERIQGDRDVPTKDEIEVIEAVRRRLGMIKGSFSEIKGLKRDAQVLTRLLGGDINEPHHLVPTTVRHYLNPGGVRNYDREIIVSTAFSHLAVELQKIKPKKVKNT